MPLSMTCIFSVTATAENNCSVDVPRATLIVCPLSVLSNWIVSVQCYNV